MPDMSGEEVFRAIRTIRPEVKVIVSSGYNEQETVSMFQGLAGFIQKPYQPMKLIEKVREVLAPTDCGRSAGASV
jgi:two-component system cell cycle sensor histidine kinase/response regulator CckA